MFEESYFRTLHRVANAALGILMAAAAFAGDVDPKKMGYGAVVQSDTATIALLAQRIVAAVNDGDPYLYLNFIAKDYAEESEIPVQNLYGREAFLKAVQRGSGSSVEACAVQLAGTSIDGINATCVLLVHTGTDQPRHVNLNFAKQAAGWLLVKSNGLAQIARNMAAHRSSLAKTNTASQAVLSSNKNETTERTFIPKDLAAEHQIRKLTRSLTQERLHRNLFSLPYGSAFFAKVEQFDSAPFIAANYVQLVTDPAWHRIIYGDYQRWIKAYDGYDSGVRLQRPHGLAVDAQGFVYVADTGNRRVLVLKLSGPAHGLTLSYVGTLNKEDLSQPLELAWDDRGTIFDNSDDLVWVIDHGARVLLAYRAAVFSGDPIVRYQSEQFIAPAALALGRFDGRSDGNLYLADAGARKLFRFYFDGQELITVQSMEIAAETVPAGLAADHWGNVYLADAAYRRVQKFSTNLTLLATLGSEDETFQPARFQPLFGSIARPDRTEPLWSGYDQAFLLEEWSENSGARRYELGIDFVIDDLRLHEDLAALVLSGKLTDAGYLKTELIDEAGTAIKNLIEGWHNAGEISLAYDRRNAAGQLIAPGYYKFRHTLHSTYDKPQTMTESAAFYLPLYYYEDCGGAPAQDMHLMHGTRHANFGTEAGRSVATDPQAVIYRFAGLNPEITYEVRTSFFAALGEVEQALYAGQDLLQETKMQALAASTTDWLEIPAHAVVGGKLDLHIVKTNGSGEASVAEIWLREAHYDADQPRPPRSNTAIPQQFVLEQNYPNPFNPTTAISFSLPEGFRGNVTLRVYNMLGEMVRELLQRDLRAGNYRERWDGLDASGRRVASGVFIYQLRAGNFSATKKLVMMK